MFDEIGRIRKDFASRHSCWQAGTVRQVSGSVRRLNQKDWRSFQAIVTSISRNSITILIDYRRNNQEFFMCCVPQSVNSQGVRPSRDQAFSSDDGSAGASTSGFGSRDRAMHQDAEAVTDRFSLCREPLMCCSS